MKMFLALSASLVAGVSLMATVAASHAEVKPGCIGGCMGTAIAAPTPVFPVGYQCNTNWPLPANSVACPVAVGNTWAGDHPHHEPPVYSRPKN